MKNFDLFVGVDWSGAKAPVNTKSIALVSAAGLRYICGMKSKLPDKIAYPPPMSRDAKQVEGWIFGVGDQEQKGRNNVS